MSAFADSPARGEAQSRIRVGVVLDSPLTSAWIARAVSLLAGSGFLECVFLIDGARPVSRRAARLDVLRTTLFALYQRLDRAVFAAAADALAVVDATSELSNTPIVPLRPGALDGRGGLDEVARDRDLHALIWLAASAQQPELANAAGCDVWSLRHGDGVHYGGEPPVFWEIYDGTPVTITRIEIRDHASGAVRHVYRSHSATDAISLYRARNRLYWKAATFFVRQLRELDQTGRLRDDQTVDEGDHRGRRGRLDGAPTVGELLLYVLRLSHRAIKRQIASRFYEERWVIAWRRRRDASVPPPPEGFELIEAPRGRSIMDPFLVENDGEHFIFCEDYSSEAKRGSISFLRRGRDGTWSGPTTVMARNHHLSYPFIFRAGRDIYMIPETAAAKRIELHRAASFPREWVLERVLISDVVAFDATMVEHAGKLWLFASVPEEGAAVSEELSVFHASSLYDEWTPHPMNPVVSDVRSARPAGRIFRSGELLIRPAQDCSYGYGYAVVYNHIDVLTEVAYREREVGRLGPEWLSGNVGTHAYDFNDDLEVVDARRRTLAVGRRGRR